jgi:hypothetical protein
MGVQYQLLVALLMGVFLASSSIDLIHAQLALCLQLSAISNSRLPLAKTQRAPSP